MAVDGTELWGPDGMWAASQQMNAFLHRVFTEMPWALFAWALLALTLLMLGRFLWRRPWTVSIHVDNTDAITNVDPLGRGAAKMYRRDGIDRLESFANSEPPPY